MLVRNNYDEGCLMIPIIRKTVLYIAVGVLMVIVFVGELELLFEVGAFTIVKFVGVSVLVMLFVAFIMGGQLPTIDCLQNEYTKRRSRQ